MGRFYVVSQNQSYFEERELGILFAPTRTSDGKTPLSHWLTMDDLGPEDVIFCAYKQRIVSVAIPVGPSVITQRPPELPDDWVEEGWVCSVEYHDLGLPIHLYEEVAQQWRVGESRFTSIGKMTQQYLVEVSPAFAAYLLASFGDRLSASIMLPAEWDLAEVSSDYSESLPLTTQVEAATASTTVRKPVAETIRVTLAHGVLVRDYADFIEQRHGIRPVGRAYSTPVTATRLRADVVDEHRGLLLEAKPELTVDELYRAIGQLAIYSQLEESATLKRGVLVGSKPAPWFLARLSAEGIACVWATDDGFADNAKGALV